MLGGEFLSFVLALIAARSDEHDLRTKRCCGCALNVGNVAGQNNDRSNPELSGSVRDSLGVVAAGICNDSAFTFLVGERRNFVVRAAQLEGADRLLVFRLQVELAGI